MIKQKIKAGDGVIWKIAAAGIKLYDIITAKKIINYSFHFACSGVSDAKFLGLY
jgi:hypothetical protein